MLMPVQTLVLCATLGTAHLIWINLSSWEDTQCRKLGQILGKWLQLGLNITAPWTAKNPRLVLRAGP